MLDGGEAEEVFSEFLDALEPEQRRAALDSLRDGKWIEGELKEP